MTIYIICFFMICTFAFLSKLFWTKKSKFFFLLSAAFILFLICFRDETVGKDVQYYIQYFQWFSRHSLKQCFGITWEPGYILLSKAISVFGKTGNTYIVVMGIICLVPFFVYTYRYSCSPIICLLVFYCFFFTAAEYLNRQWCALLILLFSTRYIIERKFWKFFLFIIFAEMFHRTAIAFIPLYYLYGLKVNKKLLISMAGVSAILGVVGQPLIIFLRRFSQNKDELLYEGGISMLALLWLCTFFVFIVAKKRLQDNPENNREKLFFTMLLSAATIQPVCFALSLWSRIVMYYSVAMCFSLPMAIKEILKVRNNKVFAPIIWCVFIGLLFVFVRVFGWQSSGEHVFKNMQL